MSSVLSLFYSAEPFLMVIALLALWRSKERGRFPALFVYFVLRLTSYVVLAGMLHAPAFLHASKKAVYVWYFWTYWSTYIIGAIVVFFVIQELFKYAMEPLLGLKRLGAIAFRWVTCVSFVAAFAAALTPHMPGYRLLMGACDQLMRCESVFLLCLLFFLMVSADKLGLSYRSRVFGISFGFGIMAASNLVSSAFLLNFAGHATKVSTSAISIMDTGASLLTLIVWSVYFVRKEPARNTVAMSVTSPLVRWNEIAMALGNSGGRVVVAPPASDFFLQDVEKVVDRILTKNSLSAAS